MEAARTRAGGTDVAWLALSAGAALVPPGKKPAPQAGGSTVDFAPTFSENLFYDGSGALPGERAFADA